MPSPLPSRQSVTRRNAGPLLDAYARPITPARFRNEYDRSYGGGGTYDGANPTRVRDLGFSPAWDEAKMLPFASRVSIIAYLRKAVRNNPILSAMVLRHALGIGSPTFHSTTSDPAFNRAKDIFLNACARRVGFANNWTLKRLLFVINCELLIAGEVFAVFTQNGKVQLIPSELCGSPGAIDGAYASVPGEIQGIVYDADGQPLQYRFGKRQPGGWISYNLEQGATFVDARYVKHLGYSTRIEERRFAPPLAAAIGPIADLDDIVRSKVLSVKIQSAYTLFITKNMDPEFFREMMAASAAPEKLLEEGAFFDQYLARSDYQTIRNGGIMYGETGEDIKALSPAFQAADFTEFERGRIERITNVIGMPAEEIMSYRDTTYSSSRADKLRWKQAIENNRDDQEFFLDDWQEWQCNRAQLFEDLPDSPEGQERNINWVWPPLPAIDETKTAQSQIARRASGVSTNAEVCGENGEDGFEHQQKLVDEATVMAQLIKRKAEPAKYASLPLEEIPVTVEEITAHLPNAATTSQALASLATANAQHAAAAASAKE